MSKHPALAARPSGPPDPTAELRRPGALLLIHAAFEAQAQQTPSADALRSAHGVCSYRELEEISAAIAHFLRGHAVGSGQTVAIYADRNPALLYALLGVVRCGAAFQILDAAYPLPRLEACARQTVPDFLLVAGDLPFPSALADSIELSGPAQVARVPAELGAARAAFLGSTPVRAEPVELPAAWAPEQTAYFSFTSGSTGTPKGIATAHAPLPHFIAWHVAHGALSASDQFSMLSGLSHDPLLRDVFTPLSIGACLHIPAQSTLFDADALFAWFLDSQISVAHLTPAFGEILLAGAGEQGRLEALRRLYWGGDVLTRRLVRSLQQVAPHAEHTNFYGATETPQAMGYFDLAELGEALHEDTPIPLGRGIEGAQLLIVDAQNRLCREGELGEIWIRSPFLSKGYLDPVSTEARFVPNPFRGAADDRCYRTGDRGLYLASGDVSFAGRADHQIKLRGFRIEPAEISAVLERVEGVRRAIIQVVELQGDKQLVAYLAHGKAPAPTVVSLRQALQAQLPSYMVPRFLMVLSEFPLLPNGKVDLLALPAPELERPVQGAGQRLPRTEAERAMAAIWAELLGLEQVAIDQSFLDLGGDSLSAIRALSRMRRLGIPESVARGIFQGRTIEQLTCAGDPGVSTPGQGERPALRGSAKTTLLINVLRGFLVLTLVADHWKEGVFKRFPQLPRALTQAIEPVFDLPTPGFAFVFGIGLAYSQYENFLRNPGASRRMLWNGAKVLALGTLLMGLSRNLGVVARGLPIDYDLFCTNFFLPTLYYLLALASAPLWFAFLARREGKLGGSLVAALLLAVGCRLLYEVCRLVLLPHEQTGLLQLGRLMLTARFSYFNLSTGALLGVCFGLYLRRNRERESLLSLFLGWGTGVLAAGLLLFYARRDVVPDGLSSPDILLPKWLVYVGGSLLLGAVFEGLLQLARRAPLRGALEWLGVIGQCAMPIFILQGVALDVSAFGRALGLPDKLATALAVVAFLSVVGSLMRRIHALYYGAIASDTQPGRAGGAPSPA